MVQDWRDDSLRQFDKNSFDSVTSDGSQQIRKTLLETKSEIDEHPIISENEYWIAIGDHWKRLEGRSGQLPEYMRFLQISNMIENLLQVLEEESKAASKVEDFSSHSWMLECTLFGLSDISEALLLIARQSSMANQYEGRQNTETYKQIELHLKNLQKSHARWLEPLNTRLPALDSTLILRTLSSTERVLRIYHQEFVSQKNRNIASQSLLAICGEALFNVRKLQQHQITYIANHFQLTLHH